ncbi:MAG TPA: LLM class F420-dependent oxidoreductase [Myxococcales bacterium]|nr:LLM class F420-dependent oxidoreductase [Myxococcales bacterium]HIL00490.1 LLM class F420-dependent oxidoreductase [Myxococcales bacterium]
MQFWQSTAFNDPLELPVIAQEAEAAGFDGIIVSEHLMVPSKFKPGYLYSEDGRPPFDVDTPFPDPWVAIATMAAVTSRIRFCTLVHILPLHHPVEVAKSLATLALYSDNRVLVGAGAGWMKEEFDVLGIDFKTRGKRFNEMIEVMRKLWQGGEVEHHGECFDFPSISQNPAPTKPIPIAIGGASKAALRRAATLGDGWCGAGNTPDEAEEILRTLATLRKEAGREAEPFEAIVPLTTEPTPDSLKRISDLGATGTVSYPFSYTVGPDASLQQKIDAMKQFSEYVIEPNRDV